MINGFEDHTAPLTDDERFLVSKLIPVLNSRLGVGKAWKSGQIEKYIMDEWGIKCTGARIRKIINHIRRHQLVKGLISSSKGYYRAVLRQEIDMYVTSLRQRAQAINAVADSFEEPLDGQLTI